MVDPIGSVPNAPRITRAFSNIQPFTYSDGWSFLKLLEEIRNYIENVLVPFIQEGLDQFADEVIAELNALVQEARDILAQIEAIQTEVEATAEQIAQMLADVEAIYVQIQALVADANAAADRAEAAADRSEQAVGRGGSVSLVAPPRQDTRTGTYNRPLCLYNEASVGMHQIRLLTRRAMYDGDHIKVGFTGMSKNEGYGTQAYGTGMFGSSPSYRLMQIMGGTSGVVCLNDYDGRTSFAGGIAQSSNLYHKWGGATTGQFTILHESLEAFTEFDLYYFTNTAANPITIIVDGGTPINVDLPRAADIRFESYRVDGLTNTTHTISISGGADFVLPAIRYNPQRTTGLEISNYSRSSSAAGHWLPEAGSNPLTNLWSVSTGQPVGSSGINPFPKQHFYIVQTGLNYSTEADIRAYVQHMVQDSGGRVMLATPGGYATETATAAQTLRDILYDLADEYDLPLLDYMDYIGYSPEANSRDLMSDGLHENWRGYVAEAALIKRALIG